MIQKIIDQQQIKINNNSEWEDYNGFPATNWEVRIIQKSIEAYDEQVYISSYNQENI